MYLHCNSNCYFQQIAQAAEEVIREIESSRHTSKPKTPECAVPSVSTSVPPSSQTNEARPMLVSVASTVVRSAETAMPDNLQFMYTGTNSITNLENFLQPVSQ